MTKAKISFDIGNQVDNISGLDPLLYLLSENTNAPFSTIYRWSLKWPVVSH